MTQPIKIFIGLTLLVGGLIALGLFLNYNYNIEVLDREREARLEKQEVIRQEKLDRQEMLRKCSEGAETDYVDYWDAQCPIVGLDMLTPGCTLPRYIALDIEIRREKALSNCIKLYSPK